MEKKSEKRKNRVWCVINYTSLSFILILFYAGKSLQWPLILIIFEMGLTAFFILSLRMAFIKSKLWRFVHLSEKELDEREIQLILRSLKYSYSIFTIVCLVVIYGFAVAAQGPIDVLLAGALLYLAHTLPAAVVGWQAA
jgi:hypothetical protein